MYEISEMPIGLVMCYLVRDSLRRAFVTVNCRILGRRYEGIGVKAE